MPVEAVIFDMDGVLIDSERTWEQARMAFSRKMGKAHWTPEHQRRAMGHTSREWVAMFQEAIGTDLPFETVYADLKANVLAQYAENLPLLPGALDAVRLAAGRYQVGLASGSSLPVIRRVLELSGLGAMLDAFVSGDEVARGKPAPDIYLETARRLGVPPGACIAVEDSGNGIRAAKAAGMVALAVPTREHPITDGALALADRVLASLLEFTVELVDSLA